MPYPNFHVALFSSHTGQELTVAHREATCLIISVNSMNGAERISDIEGTAATGSGERAGKRSDFQNRIWSLALSFFDLCLCFPNVLHRSLVLRIKGNRKMQH